LLLSEFGFLIDLIHKKKIKKKTKQKKTNKHGLNPLDAIYACKGRSFLFFSFLFDELKLLWNKLNPSTNPPIK